MKRENVFVATSGLNVKVDPVRTGGKEGVVELTSCLNVDVDDTGRVGRRKGYTLWLSGSWHSLFAGSEYMLGVKGDALSVLQGGSSTAIRNVREGARMHYARVWDGGKEVIYYMNGAEVGKVYGKVSYAVAVPDSVGPTTSKDYVTVPIGENLCVWNGRLFVVTDKVVWYSEPFNYEAFDLARGFLLFDSDVKMIIPLLTGLMIGTGQGIFLLRGTTPAEFQLTQLAGYGVIEGTEAQYDKAISLGNGLAFHPWFFGSKKGICILTQEGQFMNLTDNKVPYPEGLRGSGGFIDDKYILNIEG